MAAGEENSPARQRLLDAALDQFAQHGFAGASIRGITGQLGLRESAYYSHFKSKQDAYDKLFHEGGPAVVQRAVAELRLNTDPAIALAQLGQAIMSGWTTRRARALASIVLRESFEHKGEKRTELLRGIDSALDSLTKLLRGWQKSGRLANGIPPRARAFQFVAPLVTIRFLYYNLAADNRELKLGAKLVAEHVKAFILLVCLQGSRD